MIDITITRDGGITNRGFKADLAAAEEWVASCERDCAFGRPAGWYRLPDGVDSSLPVFLTYDGKWMIDLEDISIFEVRPVEEAPIPQLWAKCKAEYDITYTDLDQDSVYISSLKSVHITRVHKEVDRIVGSMYSMSEMILYAMIDGNLPDQFLEIKGTIQAAYADADPVIRIINECTTSNELNALKGYKFTVLGEPACL